MRVYECTNCRFSFPSLLLFKSRHTHLYYCKDTKQCDRRHDNDLTHEEFLTLSSKTLHDLKGVR